MTPPSNTPETQPETKPETKPEPAPSIPPTQKSTNNWFTAIAATGGIGLVFAGIGAALQGLRHTVPVVNEFLTNAERFFQNLFGRRR